MNRDYVEEGFKEGLNNQFGSVIIAGMCYPAADVLKACDKYHYDILFLEYMLEIKE